MSSAGMFQTQISAIMKAAAVEISQLLEEEAAALHQEIRRRNQEIQGLKTKLLRVTAERCSVGVQVEIMDTSVTAHSREAQADHHSQEKVVVKNLSEEKPHFSQQLKQEEYMMPLKEPKEEELSRLEFEMKIEQVEEHVDQKLNQVQAKQKFKGQNRCHDGNTRLWCSGKAFDHPESVMESEQHSHNFTDPYVMEDSITASTQSGLLAVLQNESVGVADIEYDLDLQDSYRSSPSTSESDSTPFNTLPSSHSSSCLPKTLNAGKHTGPKPFRCEECGKGFPQRGRLLTHKLVHMDEKPFQCEECGKGFTQRKRLLTHRLVHTGEKPFRCQLCGKTFSRQDSCLRHMRLHSGQR
ncbi:hypothetical protein PO909_031697 [Leuciscus waleckii]